MSRDSSNSLVACRSSSQSESRETEIENSLHPAHFPLPRTPLNSIPDPSQYQKETLESDGDDKQKLEGARFSRLLEKKVEALDKAGFSYSTPKFSSRGGKLNSEPSSTQSTPARGGSRMSLGGVTGVYTGPRGRESIGGRGVNVSSRVSRGIQIANSDVSVQSPHFELEEDASFWNDHNVQVLIRIRPLSNMEKVSQGYGRCLRQETGQSLVWLGHPETRFRFDHVACKTISQEKLFRVAGLPMVENCLSGYNSCMFAYGQTGSGKTYTMMGEIAEVEGKFSKDCGITPRIFEYLFTRIRVEEESRRDEKLTYSCKCSFLEIYNEQTTDLLEPSSANLQLREDMKKGVYVENLKEYKVRTVGDVVKLLLHGAANRKIAATDMNSESSRSHSVFTCIIESSWEKDSMNHFRFARLNLVDLAGSERQKSSGADGDRLKEAANINKSLSTLGLVIMSLVDLAHGKQRHIPYRDSRLTFLLQDSLGGNSKTTIIANVSPSMCSASETLSTLKFAQRAKLIQNNAKVNEDASGDVNALQKQIQLLKDQLSSLMDHQIPPRSLLEGGRGFEASCSSAADEHDCPGQKSSPDNSSEPHIHDKKTLVGALRRERIMEIEVQKLKVEIEQMSCLVRKREADAEHSYMMLKLREEKIKMIEMLIDGKTSGDQYLMEENKALLEEIKLLQDKIKNNPEITQFPLEHEKLQNGNLEDMEDLEETRKKNFKLIREVEELRTEMGRRLRCSQTTYSSDADPSLKDHQEFSKDGKRSSLEILSVRSDSEDEMTSRTATDDECLQTRIGQSGGNSSDMKQIDNQKELTDAKLIIEALEADQVHLLNELQQMQEENGRLMEILENADNGERSSMIVSEIQSKEQGALRKKKKGAVMERGGDGQTNSIQATVDRIMQELEDVTLLNNRYQEERASQLSQQKEVDLVHEQVELETARTILQLQEDVAAVKLEFDEKLTVINKENLRLRETVAAKQEEIEACNANWENATIDLTKILLDGSRSIKDASKHIATIGGSFPQVNISINDHVEKAATACIEEEKKILELQKSLEDARKTVTEMEQKLGSLKGATIALSEIHHLTNCGSAKEAIDLNRKLQEKTNTIRMLERLLKHRENQIIEAAKQVYAVLLVTKWAFDHHGVVLKNNSETERVDATKVAHSIGEQFQSVPDRKANVDSQIVEHLARAKLESAVCDPQSAVNSLNVESKTCKAELQADIHKESATLGVLAKGITDLRNDDTSKSQVRSLSLNENGLPNTEHLKGLVLCSTQNSEDEGCGFRTSTQCQFGSQEKADNKFRNADNFLSKFEEANATMEEADLMLNELIKANEEAKTLTDIWKQAGEQLIVERTSLIKEVEQLKYSLNLKEGENEQLMDTLHHAFVETENSLSLLKQCFKQMQRDADQMFMAMQAEVLSVERDILDFLRNFRSSVEDLSCEIMEKSFMLFVLFQCHIGHITQKLPIFSSKWGNDRFKQLKQHPRALDVHNTNAEGASISKEGANETEPSKILKNLYTREVDPEQGSRVFENLSPRKDLERKDVLLKGLLFDFRLLQESASNTKMKLDEAEESLLRMSEVRHELDLKTSQLDDMVVQQRNLELRLAETEKDLSISLSDLEQANGTVEILSDQNVKLRTLLKDVYLQKSELEEQLDEQKEVVKGLEEEILHLTISVEEKVISSGENTEDELKFVVIERDQLLEEVRSLNDKLQLVSSLADENEAIAIEARQESEASKIYAEQKEEEVKILEHSVEELEHTIDVLEKKVNEMNQDVKRQRKIRDALELELQALRERLSTVEDFTDAACVDSVKKCDPGELNEARRRIKILESERIEHEREIKQCKDYISELVLHAEAQASQYQQKYKALESMVHEVKTDISSSISAALTVDKNEKSVVRPRGSSSPFRCISSLIHQTNMEKEQELSTTKIRMQELEAFAASQQKEVCMLSTRLAATESMTHDVIRDLLGVKLDLTNYANFIEQHQVQTLVETAFQQKEDLRAKEQEVLQLMKQIEDLIEERESCIAELKKKEADIFATEINLEQLQQRDQMLSAQNEMLKIDKSNLKRRVIELDEMVKTLLGTQSSQRPPQHTLRMKENGLSRVDHFDLNKKLAQSEKLLSCVNNELAQFRSASSSNLQERTSRHGFDTVKRRPKV